MSITCNFPQWGDSTASPIVGFVLEELSKLQGDGIGVYGPAIVVGTTNTN